MSERAAEARSTAPERSMLVLAALILVAAVANLNLSVANVALPDIGAAFDSSQTTLNLIAVGYSLGLAGSVLYLGAIGDRYGRKHEDEERLLEAYHAEDTQPKESHV